MAATAVMTKSNANRSDVADSQRSHAASLAWSSLSLKQRLACIARFRRSLANDSQPFVDALAALPWRSREAESLAAEVLPLLDAAKFLEKQATRLLKPKRHGRKGRPLWLEGVRAETRREPWGHVLIIAPSNYPLLLPGVQMLQALVAGNRVSVKPSPASQACSDVMWLMFDRLVEAGVPSGALRLLDSNVSAAGEALRNDSVDKVVLTGSLETGRAVMRELVGDEASATARPTPAVMELSGCDAMFVLQGADQQRVLDALRMGLIFNQSATCIAPRRIFVDDQVAKSLRPKVETMVRQLPKARLNAAMAKRVVTLKQAAINSGATIIGGDVRSHTESDTDRDLVGVSPMLIIDDAAATDMFDGCDIFAPVTAWTTFTRSDDALEAAARCDYKLGASVFGQPEQARHFAGCIDAGTVTVNDLIAPTADPRVAFTAVGNSGFGATRGAEGLLEMTRPKVILERRGGITAHFDPPHETDAAAMRALMTLTHGSTWWQRIAAARTLMKLDRFKKKQQASSTINEPEGSTGKPS